MAITRALAVLSLTLLAAGYGGAVSPAGDALAVLRVPLAVCSFVLCLVLWRHRWARAGALASVVALAALVPGWISPWHAPDESYRLYQKNWLFKNRRVGLLEKDVAATRPHFVTLQEIRVNRYPELRAALTGLPHSYFCERRTKLRRDFYGLALFSVYPFLPGTLFCHEDVGLAGGQVDTPDGPVWLISLHLEWPWPYNQPENLTLAEPILKALDGPKLIGGDFNAMAWSNAVARLERASGTRRVGPTRPSFYIPYVPIPIGIDHVLTTGMGPQKVQMRPWLGSDHKGVLAEVTVTRP